VTYDFLWDLSSLGEGMVGHRRLVFTCILYRKHSSPSSTKLRILTTFLIIQIRQGKGHSLANTPSLTRLRVLETGEIDLDLDL